MSVICALHSFVLFFKVQHKTVVEEQPARAAEREENQSDALLSDLTKKAKSESSSEDE